MPNYIPSTTINAIGGTQSALGLTSPIAIATSRGVVYRVLVSGTLTAGALTLNDCATTGAASASNQILSVPFGSISAGKPFELKCTFLFGLVLSAVPTGAVVTVTYT